MRTLLLLLLGLMGPLGAQTEDVVAAFEAGESVVEVAGEARSYPWRLHRPASASAAEPKPLIVFLHGRGENGKDNRRQLRWLPEWMITEEHLKGREAFVLAVQTDSTWSRFDRAGGGFRPRFGEPVPAMTALIGAIRRLAQDPAIDRRRIYVTGLSLGGFGTWELIARHPDWFAAAVPVCGGADVAIARRLARARLPIWTCHGAADRLVPPERTRAIVAALREAGGVVGYTELPGVGHDAWNFAYGPAGCMEWLFAQQRAEPAEIAPPR